MQANALELMLFCSSFIWGITPRSARERNNARDEIQATTRHSLNPVHWATLKLVLLTSIKCHRNEHILLLTGLLKPAQGPQKEPQNRGQAGLWGQEKTARGKTLFVWLKPWGIQAGQHCKLRDSRGLQGSRESRNYQTDGETQEY